MSRDHPLLRFLFLVDVKMQELPHGLLPPDFSQTLHDLELSRTNLAKVPDHLDTVWPKGMFVEFEECAFEDFPLVVLRMEPQDLTLGLNDFTTVPAELLENLSLRLLLLDGNSIQSFSSKLKQPPAVAWFDLIGTDITKLLEWMDDAYLASTVVIAANTPLCSKLIAAGEADDVGPRALIGLQGVDCLHASVGNGTMNWCPIDDEVLLNPSYTLE
uniref:Leucine-rich repeat-containing N-terminal plant-type domain-containing protein n=1 Tax=Globisporangium ultimum (strain ATCC 200006 / CBS 805.95 / DAOM BR144) TaxID=431595 RepID=K3X4K5_GLOUD